MSIVLSMCDQDLSAFDENEKPVTPLTSEPFSALLILFPLLRMALSHFQTEKERDQREEWKIKWGGKEGLWRTVK